jgi:flagellar hook-associated protein 3 FlgL
MTIVRDSSAYRALQYSLAKNTTKLNQLYVKTSSGIEVAKASDNPSAVQKIVSCRSSIVAGERYIENCKSVQDNLSSSETYIDSVLDIMERAKEIGISAANDTLSASDLNTYINEVNRMQETLLDLANSQVDGKYIFAGYQDTIEPFTGSPVTYNGTTDHQMITVSSGSTVAGNITGEELFMSPVDLFTTLDDLITVLGSGDTTLVSGQLDQLEAAAEQVRSQQSALGNSSARLDDLMTMHSNSNLLLTETLSASQDADLTELLSEISKYELSVEATMQVTGRVSALNLFDYL